MTSARRGFNFFANLLLGVAIYWGLKRLLSEFDFGVVVPSPQMYSWSMIVVSLTIIGIKYLILVYGYNAGIDKNWDNFKFAFLWSQGLTWVLTISLSLITTPMLNTIISVTEFMVTISVFNDIGAMGIYKSQVHTQKELGELVQDVGKTARMARWTLFGFLLLAFVFVVSDMLARNTTEPPLIPLLGEADKYRDVRNPYFVWSCFLTIFLVFFAVSIFFRRYIHKFMEKIAIILVISLIIKMLFFYLDTALFGNIIHLPNFVLNQAFDNLAGSIISTFMFEGLIISALESKG